MKVVLEIEVDVSKFDKDDSLPLQGICARIADKLEDQLTLRRRCNSSGHQRRNPQDV